MASAKPRVREDLDVLEVDGEAVVYDPVNREVHYLNHSAALVLGLCDGTATARALAGAIAEVYEMPLDDVSVQVRELIKGLRKKKLLAKEGAPAPAREAAHDAGRLVRLTVPNSG